jgi:hypothetical protein
LLHKSVKKLPSALRFAPVESKCEFIQIIRQVLVAHGTLMSPEQPAFQQRGNPMDPRQMLAGLFSPASQHGDLPVITLVVETFVSLPPVRVYRAAWFDAVIDKSVQTSCRRVLNRPQSDSPDSRAIGFCRNCYQGFVAFLATSYTLLQSPEPVSSTSTQPESFSRPGRTIACRSLWSQVQAV